MLNIETVLVLDPHTDDGVLGCGGTIARLTQEGKNVYYVTFSLCAASIPAGLPSNILATEARRACQVLGIPSRNLEVKDYPVRSFPDHRQEILDDLIVLRDTLKPNLVLLPSTHDIHQDHQVLAQEGLRAFKHSTILGYEMPWNNLQFIAPAIFTLQNEQIEAKIEASLQYKSQEHRNYIGREFITSLARVRGQQANRRFGEAFQVVRWIV